MGKIQARERGLKKLGLSHKEDSLIFPGDESAPKTQIGYRPLMDQFIRLGSQSIGFCNEANTLKASLQQAEERDEALEAKLKLSKEAREKAQADAASVEELRQRLSKAESALRDCWRYAQEAIIN
ncbi:hypothetical protein QYE76_029485 [Lolium multiflorum]|uniref:Uncharacterized protein n=1 Tax=Lolium multiflorum TaxID=4521 RepID=A0AAD8QNP1_LOLMU|nr:hypothetical protein QYE76_029485 [Lolium multiflorum]